MNVDRIMKMNGVANKEFLEFFNKDIMDSINSPKN